MDGTGDTAVLLRVEGMTCTGCEQRIGKALARLDGVRAASADQRSGQVRVSFDPALVVPAALATRIEQAGFRVTGLEQEVPS